VGDFPWTAVSQTWCLIKDPIGNKGTLFDSLIYVLLGAEVPPRGHKRRRFRTHYPCAWRRAIGMFCVSMRN
jgi:hypothetical protein